MVKEIRMKKRKMQDDPDVVDSGDSPGLDAQDIDNHERMSLTKDLGLDHNEPGPGEDHEDNDLGPRLQSEDPSAMSLADEDGSDAPHEEEEPLSKAVHMMAEGGDVKGVHKEQKHPLTGESRKGRSEAGDYVDQAGQEKSSYARQSLNTAKGLHKDVLNQMRSMPKPKLQGLAEGGSVDAEQEDMSEAMDHMDHERMARHHMRMAKILKRNPNSLEPQDLGEDIPEDHPMADGGQVKAKTNPLLMKEKSYAMQPPMRKPMMKEHDDGSMVSARTMKEPSRFKMRGDGEPILEEEGMASEEKALHGEGPDELKKQKMALRLRKLMK